MANGCQVAWANSGTANKLFRNDAAAGQHRLQVKLRGAQSNRAGIGARVRVVAGGVSRIREIPGIPKLRGRRCAMMEP